MDVNKGTPKSERTAGEANDSSFMSMIASFAGMTLAVIGLGGIRTYWMAALALILVGIAQLFEGERLSSNVSGLIEIGEWPLGRRGIGMMTGRLPGGIIGVVLGVLSLLAVIPAILLPVATIILGVVLVLGAWTIVRLNDLHADKACEKEEARAVARVAVRIAEILEAFLGCGSIALGIIALSGFGFTPVILTLVAMLGIGFSSLLNSNIFSKRVMGSLIFCKRTTVIYGEDRGGLSHESFQLAPCRELPLRRP